MVEKPMEFTLMNSSVLLLRSLPGLKILQSERIWATMTWGWLCIASDRPGSSHKMRLIKPPTRVPLVYRHSGWSLKYWTRFHALGLPMWREEWYHIHLFKKTSQTGVSWYVLHLRAFGLFRTLVVFLIYQWWNNVELSVEWKVQFCRIIFETRLKAS
jgi:hypothetical protein